MKLSNIFLFALVHAQEDGGDAVGDEAGSERWGGQVVGDPHFIISGKNLDSLCFNYTPDLSSDITLLSDPTSALSVTGTPEMREDGKTSLSKIHFRSPGGAVLEFDQDGFNMPSDEEGIAVKYGHIKYHDVTITDHWGDDHAKTKLTITDGPTFTIKEKVNKGALTFHVADPTGLSEKCRGLIGQFFHSDSYSVEQTNEQTESGLDKGIVTVGDVSVPAVFNNWHHMHQEKCWIIEEEDMISLLDQF